MAKHLIVLGVVVLSVLAGCGIGDGAQGSNGPPTPTNGSLGGDPVIDRSEFFDYMDIGPAPDTPPPDNAPHYYFIGNDQPRNRTIGITVWQDSAAVIDRSFEFPPNGFILIRVFATGDYTLAIDPPNAPRHVIDVPNRWDCNRRGVRATVQPNGSLEAEIYEHNVECL